MALNDSAILLLSCPDKKGIVAAVSTFIAHHNGNIVTSEQHTDYDDGLFFMRIEWELKDFTIPKEKIVSQFTPIADQFSMQCNLQFSHHITNTAVFVSKHDHCLVDLVWRQRAGELPMHITMIVSNHRDTETFARQMQIPFLYVPISKDHHHEQEVHLLETLQKERVNLIVLARYMQIVGTEIVDAFPHAMINIHHSFLPAFVGGKPYQQAFERGVKIVGATSHYVTQDLDQGPIIEQDVIRVNHKDTIDDMMRKGRDLEKIVLSRAVRLHCAHKILVHGKKTIVFD